MTIPEQDPINEYVGDGIEDTFAYTFRILEDDDITVTVDDTLQVLNIDYTLQNPVAEGGDIVFDPGSIPGSGLDIVIIRETDQDQNTVYTEFDPFPADSHENALDKLTMLVQDLKRDVDAGGGGGGGDDATYLRLDATNDPLTGTLATRDMVPDNVADRNIGTSENRYHIVFGELGVFMNTDGVIDTDLPINLTFGGLATGSQLGPGTRRHILGGSGTIPASFVMGSVEAKTATGTALIEATSENSRCFGKALAYSDGAYARVASTSRDSTAMGAANTYGADSRSVVHAAGIGTFVVGYATANYAGSYSLIKGHQSAGTALGRASSNNGSYSGLITQGYGALATGVAESSGAGRRALVKVSAYGSFAFGYARAISADVTIEASGRGSFASGYAVNGQDILASAINAVQFGVGTNSQADSLAVGTGPRFKGTDGAPGTPRNGDFWVDGINVFIRSGNANVQIT